MKRWTGTAAFAAAAGAACFAWGLAEANAFTVRRAELRLLPPGAPPLRVLHVSDIHLTTRQHLKLDFLRTLADLTPDLVINTGDNIAEAEAVFPLNAAWNKLRFTPGVFVFGSNDYYTPRARNPLSYFNGPSPAQRPSPDLPWQELKRRMERFGWVDVNNAATTLEIDGLRIDFRGTDDPHLDRDDYASVAGPVDESADLTIGVTHAPYRRVLDAMTADGVDLIFAGHTHGGQVCVPGYGALVTNCDLPARQAKGLSRHSASGRTAHLQVSAGLGTSPFAPYRFACRPEVTLLTLSSRDGRR